MGKLVITILVPALLAGLLLAYSLAISRRRVHALVERYATSPDQGTANRLVKLLRKRRLSRELGDRVFKLLMTPQVAVRSSYSSEGPVYIAIGLHSNLGFVDFGVRMSESVCAGAEHLNKLAPEIGPLDKGPRFELLTRGRAAAGSVVQLDRPGEYRVRLVFRYALSDSSRPSGPPAYECSFDVPITVRVVEPEQAEKVVLKSNPRLDGRIKAAFKIVKGPELWVSHSLSGSAYRYRPFLSLEAPTFPENVALRVSYRDEAGLTTSFKNFFVSQRAGTSLGLDPSSYVIPIVPFDTFGLAPGHHRGVIVLETDADLAYQDAAMKSVWDGVIELPVKFEVREAAE